MNQGFSGGRVKIANDILAKITREASLEVKGVAEVVTGHDFVSYEKFATTDSAKGIKIAAKDGQLRIDIRIITTGAEDLAKTAEGVQQNVAEKLEVITGLRVVEVNVFIEAIAR